MNKSLKSIHYLFLSILVFTYTSCNAQVKSLSPEEFQKQISSTQNIEIVDVRTSDEFEGGYINGAKNIDWNSDNFDKKIESLDKTKPIYVYCLSGGRSSNASRKMQELGFVNVYNLEGGMMAWRSKKLPESKGKNQLTEEMSMADYEKLYKGKKKKVLIDFYAEWCIPCQKMKPYLKKIAENMKDKVEVVRINADQHRQLCETLDISGLPYILIYQDGQVEWKKMGFISETELTKLLKK